MMAGFCNPCMMWVVVLLVSTMVCSGAPPADKGTDKGGKGGKGGKDCTTGKGQSGKNPPGNITITGTDTFQQGGHASTAPPSGDSSLGWQQQHWGNAPPWQHAQESGSWPAQQVDHHDDSWGHTWPAPIDTSSAVPCEPVPIPADHSSATAASNALAAAESAHISEQAAGAHAASAQKAADEAADHLSETQTVLGEIKFVVKQFGKCNLCKKWYFVHKDLCIYPGCSRNPLTSQVDNMGHQMKALHDQVTAQEALINTLLHSSGTSSSSTASPDVLQSQAQQISALTAIIAQMVQHSAVPPSTSTLTVWQGQHLPVPKPKAPSSSSDADTITIMPIRSKPMPVARPPTLAAPHVLVAGPPALAAPHVNVALPHDLAPPAAPTAQLAYNDGGAAELHAEHPHGDDDEEDEDDGDEDDHDADTVISVDDGACGSRPEKRKKKPVVKKCVPKRKKHSAD